MTPELVTILTNQSGAVVVVGIFVWFLVGERERTNRTIQGFNKTIDGFNQTISSYLQEATRVQAELSQKLAEFKQALENIYIHNRDQSKTIKEYEKKFNLKKKS